MLAEELSKTLGTRNTVAGGVPEKNGTVQLTPEEITSIDLIFTKERLARAEERLAVINLKESQQQLMEVAKSKAILMAKLGDRLGGKLKNAKITDKFRLAYELE